MNPLEDQAAILRKMGVQKFEDLLYPIPPRIREKSTLHFDFSSPWISKKPKTESEIQILFRKKLQKKEIGPIQKNFSGFGNYFLEIPSIIDELVPRSGFITQGEFLLEEEKESQHKNFHSLPWLKKWELDLIKLTEMNSVQITYFDASNLLGEILQSIYTERKKDKNRKDFQEEPPLIYVPENFPWYPRKVLEQYCKILCISIRIIPTTQDGYIDTTFLQKEISIYPPLAILVSSPNASGLIEPLEEISEKVNLWRKKGGSFKTILFSLDLLTYFLFNPPGQFCFDFFISNLQQFGNLPQGNLDTTGFVAFTKNTSPLLSSTSSYPSLHGLRAFLYFSYSGSKKISELASLSHQYFHELQNKLFVEAKIPSRYPNSLAFREAEFVVSTLTLEKKKERLYKNYFTISDLCQPYFVKQGYEKNEVLLLSCHSLLERKTIQELVDSLS